MHSSCGTYIGLIALTGPQVLATMLGNTYTVDSFMQG
jgi:hypothetical protein